MKFPVSPFLLPDKTTVHHGGWEQRTSDGQFPLPLEMEHWDYQTELALTAHVDVDVKDLTGQCGLGPESRLRILVLARSSTTSAEIKVADVLIPGGNDKCKVVLNASVPGAASGGRLSLETLLVVADPHPVDVLAASRRGSVLWREVQHTHLQGIGTQFPTDAEDFSITRPEIAKAGWRLAIDTSDPEALFLSSVRLTLNSRHPAVTKLLSGNRDPEVRQLQRVIDVDVTRQLTSAALESEDVLNLEVDWEAVSVGGLLRNLLQQLWPAGEDLQTLRSWHVNDPARIESHIQHVRGMLE